MDRGEGLDAPPVATCDGDYMLSTEARRTARGYYIAGFFCLPWFWVVNLWLFFPHFWHSGGDAVIKKCEIMLMMMHIRPFCLSKSSQLTQLPTFKFPAILCRHSPLRYYVYSIHLHPASMDVGVLDWRSFTTRGRYLERSRRNEA